MLFFVQYSKRYSRTFEIIQKSTSCEHGDIINYVDKNVKRTCTSTAHARASSETSTCEVPRDVSRKLQLTLCVCDNGIVEVSLLHV